MRLLEGVTATARLSSCGTYRYSLTRSWDESQLRVLWVMCNPSTADADQDDQTLRACQDFTRRWGYGSLTVANLFALRSPHPDRLRQHPDPIGPSNDAVLAAAFADVDRYALVIAAWGDHGAYMHRGLIVHRMAERVDRLMHALAFSKVGRPRHPLYLPRTLEPLPWSLHATRQ